MAYTVFRPFLHVTAWLITVRRLEPSNRVIGAIDRLMGGSESRLWEIINPASGGLDLQSDSRKMSVGDRRTLIVSIAAIVARNPARAAEILQAQINEKNCDAHPRVIERLAEALMKLDRVEAAEGTLRNGLTRYPREGRLGLALVAVLIRRLHWAHVVSFWQSIPRTVRDCAPVSTHVGVTRALRKTGNPRQANDFANHALCRWPGHDELREEIRRCRPELINWDEMLETKSRRFAE